MSLPPVTVHIKRKATDEPVDFLRTTPSTSTYPTGSQANVVLQVFMSSMARDSVELQTLYSLDKLSPTPKITLPLVQL